MIVFFFFLFSFVFSQEELLDGVLAVVENKHILFSEVLGETRMVAERRGINPQSSPLLFQSLFDNVLKEKIHLQVILIAAEKDSLIDVSYEEISKSLDERISLFASELGSTEKLEEAFGLSLVDIKNNYWETVREEIIIEKFKYSMFGGLSVSQQEVLTFYQNYKDSIPSAPSFGSFSLVHKKIKPSKKTTQNIIKKLTSIKDSVSVLGFPFESFVIKHSQDPSVSTNRGIMTTSRGDLVPEYEKIAYSLKVGEIGGPVKSSFGFHLIKLLDRVGEKIKSQHLLLGVSAEKKDSLFAVSFLDSLLFETENDPGLFDSLSVSLKTNRENLSGVYNNVDVSAFPFLVSQTLFDVGDYSFSSVFGDTNNQYVLYKYFITPKEKRTPQNSWVFIERLALNKKRSDLFDLWIDNELTRTYVKINKLY